MSRPKRIQRKRTKGWRLPKGVKCVTRPGKWGNPFSTTSEFRGVLLALKNPMIASSITGEKIEHMRWILENIHELKGLDLACFCPLDKHCHADVLIELANEENESSAERELIRSLEKHLEDPSSSRTVFYILDDDGELVRTEDANEWREFWKKQEEEESNGKA